MAFLRNEYVAFALVAVAIFTVYMGLVAIFRKDPVRERIRRTLPMDVPGAGFSYAESRSPLAFFCENVLNAFGASMEKAKRELYLPLARAGLMSNEAVAYYLFFQRFVQPLFLALAALTFIRLFSLGYTPLSVKLLHLLIGGFFALIGVQGAKLYVTNRTKKRQAILQKSLADALDLMLVCVESGLPLDSALTRVTRELKSVHPEITAELDRTRVELSVLGDREQALTNLADRTDTQGFKTLVAALIQTEKFGTSIADTLRSLSEEYRTMRMLVAENKAARIPAVISLPLIILIVFPMLVLIAAPAAIRINQQGGIFPTATQQAPRR